MKNIQIPKIDTPLKKKSPGGQVSNPLDIARIIIWYKEVKKRTTLENSELDDMFIWRNPLDHLEYGPQKIFQRIGEKGMNTRGNDEKRSLLEIIECVNQHPDFLETAIVYHSKFWDLLYLDRISENDINKRIDEVFFDHEVERYLIPKIESWRFKRNPELDVSYPVNPVEMGRLLNAGLHEITWKYLGLLFYFFSKTTILRREEKMFELYTKPIREYFEELLGGLAEECFIEVLKRIQNMEVIRRF
jgi:hypothetical protein